MFVENVFRLKIIGIKFNFFLVILIWKLYIYMIILLLYGVGV